jgi:hypothetical protein
MKTHVARVVLTGALCHLTLGVALGGATELPEPSPGRPSPEPILEISWEMLRTPALDPMTASTWPAEILALEGRTVLLDGYLSLRPDAQDSVDLMITPDHPSNRECGGSTPTSVVEVYGMDGPPEEIPGYPVEVWGTFELARVPGPRPFRILALGWGACTDPSYASVAADGREDQALDSRWEDRDPIQDEFEVAYP